MKSKKLLSALVCSAMLFGFSAYALADTGADTPPPISEIEKNAEELLREAVDAAIESYTLESDVELSEKSPLIISDKGTENEPFVLDLNGHSITCNNIGTGTVHTGTTYTGALVIKNSYVSLVDSSQAKTGKIENTGKPTGTYAYYSLLATGTGTVTINDGINIIGSGDKMGGVYAYKSKVIVNNANIDVGYYAFRAYSNGSFIINGGHFVTAYDYSFYTSSMVAAINGGTFAKLPITNANYMSEGKVAVYTENGIDIRDECTDYKARILNASSGSYPYNRIYLASDDLSGFINTYCSTSSSIAVEMTVEIKDNLSLVDLEMGRDTGYITPITFEVADGASLDGSLKLKLATVTITGTNTVDVAAQDGYEIKKESDTYYSNFKDGVLCATVELESGRIYYYSDINSVLNANYSGNYEINIYKNLEVSTAYGVSAKKVVINLNGHTYKYASSAHTPSEKTHSHYAFGVSATGELTVKNGTITADAEHSDASISITSYGTITVEKDAAIDGNSIVVMNTSTQGKKSTLNIYGTVTATPGNAAIQTNGANKGDSEINIYDGAKVINDSSVAIYFPSEGTLNVYGGEISGTTAIYMASGHLNVTGGDIKSTGNKADYVPANNGPHATGDAIVLDACGYPGGAPSASISGNPVVSSVNASAVECYLKEGAEDIADKRFITGGTFSNDVNKYVKEGLVADKDSNNNYVIGANKITWTSLTDAGCYDNGEEKTGLMRFLFKADTDAEITKSGIRYVKGNLFENLAGESNTGTAAAFYGDITNIPENTDGNYYAFAYIETADGVIHWSPALVCSPNFERIFESEAE